MIQFVAQRLMDMDVETLCGAGYDVKSAERSKAATATATASGKRAPARWI